MIQMVSNEQFQEFMNQLNDHNKHLDALIIEQGRKVDAVLKEVQLTHNLVFSAYENDKAVKKGGTR